MRIPPLFAFLFLTVTHAAFTQTDGSPRPLTKSERTPAPKLVQNYRDVLSQVPTELRETKASAWTGIQREEANAAFQESFIDTETPARLRLKVTQIADWQGITFYSDVPNHEGYHIRVFGKFNDEWSRKLASVKKGDTAILEGILKSVTFRNLWGAFTLSICLKDCTFKVEPPNEPSLVL